VPEKILGDNIKIVTNDGLCLPCKSMAKYGFDTSHEDSETGEWLNELTCVNYVGA